MTTMFNFLLQNSFCVFFVMGPFCRNIIETRLWFKSESRIKVVVAVVVVAVVDGVVVAVVVVFVVVFGAAATAKISLSISAYIFYIFFLF